MNVMKFNISKDRFYKIAIFSKSLILNFIWLFILVPVLMAYEDSWQDYSDANEDKAMLLIIGKISFAIYKYYLNFPFNFYIWFNAKQTYMTLYLSWINSVFLPMVLIYYFKNKLKQLNYIYSVLLIIPIIYGITLAIFIWG